MYMKTLLIVWGSPYKLQVKLIADPYTFNTYVQLSLERQ